VGQTSGAARIGLVHSLGLRRDPKAVDALGALLTELGA
jgi:hypothetical protein